MRLNFTLDSEPRQHIADVSVVFEDGDNFLRGLELRGFAIWIHPDRGLYITTPSRPYDEAGHRRYHRFVRESTQGGFDGFRQYALAEFVARYPGVAEKALTTITARPAAPTPLPNSLADGEAFDGV